MVQPKGKLVYQGRNVKVHFDLDRRGIAKCAMGVELRAAVIDLARDVAKPIAVSLSPRSDAEHQHFQDSFVIGTGTETIRAMRRVAAYLINISPQAVSVEFGTRNTPAHRVLGKTLDYLRFRGTEHN